MAIPSEVYTYLEGILRDAGKAALPLDSKEMAIQQLASALYAVIEDANLALLPSDDLDAYLEQFKQGTTRQEKEQFLISKIPDYQVVLEQVFDDFRAVTTATLKGVNMDNMDDMSMQIMIIIAEVISRRRRPK